MGVRFACHGCGKPLNIKSDLAGKRGKCPTCQMRFRIPEHDQDFSIPIDEDDAPLTPQPTAKNNPQPTQESSHLTPDNSQASTASAQSATDNSQPQRPTAAAPQAATAQPTSEPQPVPQPSPAAPPAPAEDDFNPLDEAGVAWYVRPPAGGRYGPADGPTIASWIGEQRITPDTLLWREGWPQWRECREVLPARLLPEPQPVPQVADLARPSATASPTKPTDSTYDPDHYLGAKKRRKAKRRITVIAVLVAVSLLLVVALSVALLWPRKNPETQSWNLVPPYQAGLHACLLSNHVLQRFAS